MWPARIPLLSTMLIGALCAVLAARLVYYEPQLVAIQPAYADTVQASGDTQFEDSETLDLALYQSTLERPLFSVERRPAIIAQDEPFESPAPQVVSAPAPTADHIQFRGSVIKGGRASAFLESPGYGTWVFVAEAFDGWEVIEIGNNSVELKNGDISVVKYLYTSANN